MSEVSSVLVSSAVAAGKRPTFYGTFYHKISSRNQIALPSQFMKALKQCGEEELLQVRLPNEPFIRLLTKNHFDQKIEKLKQDPKFSEDEKAALQLMLSSAAFPAEPDSQGRFVLQPKWAAELQLKEEVAVVGAKDWVKICPAEDQRKLEEEQRDKPIPHQESVMRLLNL